MKKTNLLRTAIAAAIVITIVSCNKNTDYKAPGAATSNAPMEELMSEHGTNPDEVSINEISASPSSALARRGTNAETNGLYLYTESNAAARNNILTYQIKDDGSLTAAGSTVSGGRGTGAPLGSQGALTLDKNHEWLYAVNAHSNSVSSFKINSDGSLTLAYTEKTHGITPVSVTVHDSLLYVLNRGSDNIHGFYIGSGGTLTSIDSSTTPLSAKAVDAPQISFTPDGGRIVVTEKATNIIGTFRVRPNGSVSHGIFTPSVGPTPFGFDFSRDTFMVISNAAAGAAGGGSVTSYVVPDGKPADINGAVPNSQSAPCWLVLTKYGRFAFVSNAMSNTISSYYVAPWGGLLLVKGAAAASGPTPTDIVVASNNYFVYALNARSGKIARYRRKIYGGLELLGYTSDVPVSSTGLTTY